MLTQHSYARFNIWLSWSKSCFLLGCIISTPYQEFIPPQSGGKKTIFIIIIIIIRRTPIGG